MASTKKAKKKKASKKRHVSRTKIPDDSHDVGYAQDYLGGRDFGSDIRGGYNPLK
jgi:hypothetical protein